MNLDKRELRRYNRHIIMPKFGTENQEKLKEASVLVVGAGGLGSPALTYLAAAGVGTIGIIDDDAVDESNLQRQVMFTTSELGKKKVIIAQKVLEKQNPHIKINTYCIRLHDENAKRIISEYDIIIDATDNFPSRYLINDMCVELNKPFVYGSVADYEGQVSVFNYNNGPTYRDLYPEIGQDEMNSAAPIGVLGVMAGLIGCIQTNEAIKMITGLGQVLSGKLLTVNSLTMDFRKFTIKKNKNE